MLAILLAGAALMSFEVAHAGSSPVGLSAKRAGRTVTLVVRAWPRSTCRLSYPAGPRSGRRTVQLARNGRAKVRLSLPSGAPSGTYVYSVGCRKGEKRGSARANVRVGGGPSTEIPGVGGKPPAAGSETPGTPDVQSSREVLDEGQPADEGYGGNEPYLDGQCTRYAWRKRQDLPGNLGNASTWNERAQAQGFPVDRSPRAGDIAVWEAYSNGALWAGHVAYVESVNGNGTITISEWNWRGPRITTVRTISPGGLTFIHRKGAVPPPPPPPAPPLSASNDGQFGMDGNGVVHVTQDDSVPFGYNVRFSEPYKTSFHLRPESGPIGSLIRFPNGQPGGGDWPAAPAPNDNRVGYYRANVAAPPTMLGDYFMRWNTIDLANGRNARLQPSIVARIYPAARFDGPAEATMPSTTNTMTVAARVTNMSGRTWQKGADTLHFVDPNGNDLRYPYCPGEPRWVNGNIINQEETIVGRGQTATFLIPICRDGSYRGDATIRFNFVRERIAHYRPSPLFALRLHLQ